jgi:TPR repeat protein
MDCRKPGSKTTIDFLSGIQGKIGKFFFVLNRADIWDAEEQEEGLQFVKKALSEQCGITDSRVVLLSSTLARKPGNDHWNRCFEEFERDLNSFMRTERLLIIANEVAQQAFEVSAHAEHLLNSKWRLTEQALAGHHKRRLPDSEELIIKLRAKTLASIQNEAAITSKDFESVHEKYITNLRERVTNWVESARSKDSFGEAAEKSFERECEKVPLRLQYFLDGQTLRSHEKAQSAVAYEVSRLLNRVALLEDRAFFSRRSTYTSALCGGVAGLIVGFWTLSSAKSDFGALSMLLFVGSGLLFGLIVARNLWRASKRLPVPTRTRFSSGTHTIKLSHGFWGSVLGIVFPPSIDELKREVMKRSLKALDSLEANTATQGRAWIAREYARIEDDLLKTVDDSVRRYDRIIARIVKAQKSVADTIERRLTELRSASRECKEIQDKLAQAASVIRTTLGGFGGTMLAPESFAPTSDADVVFAPRSGADDAMDQDQQRLTHRDRTVQHILWWGIGIAAVVMFVSGFLMVPPVMLHEQESATHRQSASPAHVARTPDLETPGSPTYDATASQGQPPGDAVSSALNRESSAPGNPSADAASQRAQAFANAHQYDLAIGSYDEAIALDPRRAVFFNNRGVMYDDKGDYDRAIQDYNEAIRLDANYPEALCNRGNARAKSGDLASGISDYNQAIGLRPGFAAAIHYRYDALQKQAQQSQNHIQNNSQKEPSTAEIDQQAVDLYRKKRYSEARALFYQACIGGRADACSVLGSLYDRGWGIQQDYSKAASFLSKACDGGDAYGCSSLGNYYRLGLGVEKDLNQARDLLAKGCNRGIQWSCDRLTELQAVPAQARSGVLHYHGSPVALGGKVVFDNLPNERLRFTYDRSGWQVTIKINPDGTKWVTLTSLKQGLQTSCDLGWEVVK